MVRFRVPKRFLLALSFFREMLYAGPVDPQCDIDFIEASRRPNFATFRAS